MRVLLIPSAMASDMSPMSENMFGHQDMMLEAVKGKHVMFKLYPFDIQTYRLLALNNDKMMMILTHAYRPDTVVMFNRDEYPVLVDNAIQTFDRLYNESIDAGQTARDCTGETGMTESAGLDRQVPTTDRFLLPKSSP